MKPVSFPVPRLPWWPEQLSRFLLFASGKMRRFGLVHFRLGYVAHKREQREGTCRRCGRCCSLAFTCPAYVGDGRCLTYGLGRPKACAAFPVDERDLADVAAAGGQCGYRFRRRTPLPPPTDRPPR